MLFNACEEQLIREALQETESSVWRNGCQQSDATLVLGEMEDGRKYGMETDVDKS